MACPCGKDRFGTAIDPKCPEHGSANLRARLSEVTEERDAAIEQNKRIVAWVCQFIERRGHVVFTGLSVPKAELDAAKAEHAKRCEELTNRAEAAERRVRELEKVEGEPLLKLKTFPAEAQEGSCDD